MSDLVQEFEDLRVAVEDNLEQAAKLIDAANELALGKNYSLQSDFREEVSTLMAALENAGWSTSSMSC